jgi:hypothetical protein
MAMRRAASLLRAPAFCCPASCGPSTTGGEPMPSQHTVILAVLSKGLLGCQVAITLRALGDCAQRLGAFHYGR